MKFKGLEDRMLYYRGLSDYRLIPNSYVLLMLDGRSFSSFVKNYFDKPFDDKFINMMNETAKYLCEKIQGCKFAYVQSDEISLVITDFDTPNSDSFFGYRLEKILSISASMASAKFNQLMTLEALRRAVDGLDEYGCINTEEVIANVKLLEFDCKAWNVPSYNDVFAWNLFRQNDCLKNSKQQAAQAWLPHKQLVNKTADEQIALLKEKQGIDWNDFDDGKKYGRFIYKETVTMNSEQYGTFERDKFVIHSAWVLNDENGKEKFEKLSKIPQKS